ncbi:PIKK family atypical protein kinase [Trichomonas vaginalis G3]|uniref:Serine/threonine-protein kinase TOR n=1 Tax=Trichomonas vaginalis (strain ATCC PRA-98 / G3) TaxID=412133 RepID=A2FVZ7_TRIV3|nr:ataxia telangiectasia mutated (ATM) -related family [Trichomonas vaginalis G3]EAX90926.1 PIKK family atypical protein kinase [Trichomonas vaginalis G3]KAI5516456.1 ataxia telangiectasia mutated (ATM) -related family [Trichomonas vaginalis G3]|eukprot:XP_001303856.1 PIKK family atypical protein kinase [Trichomonas vaginalis G3]
MIENLTANEIYMVPAVYFIKFLAEHDPTSILLCNSQFLKIAKKAFYVKNSVIQIAAYKSVSMFFQYVSRTQTLLTQNSASKLFTYAISNFQDMKSINGSLTILAVIFETVPNMIPSDLHSLTERIWNMYTKIPAESKGVALYLLVLLFIFGKNVMADDKIENLKMLLIEENQTSSTRFSTLALLKYIEYDTAYLQGIDINTTLSSILQSSDKKAVKNGYLILKNIANSSNNLLYPIARKLASYILTLRIDHYFADVMPYIITKFHYFWELLYPHLRRFIATNPGLFSNVYFLQFISRIYPLHDQSVISSLFMLADSPDHVVRECVADALIAQYNLDQASSDMLPIKFIFTLALTDPYASVRAKVLQAFPDKSMKILTSDGILSNLSSIVKDEDIDVKINAIKLLGKIAKYNPFGVYPILRRVFLDFMCILDSPKSFIVKSEASTSLQAWLQAGFEIFPTSSQTFCDIVLRQLSFQSTPMLTYFERKAHSTMTINITLAIGYIAERNMDILKSYITQFHNLFLWMLQQRSDKELKLAIVTTMYTILTQIDDFYDIEISHLFPLLVSIASTWNSRKLNVAVLKLMGYIGAVDASPLGIDEVPNNTPDVLIAYESSDYLLCYVCKTMIDLIKNSSLVIHHYNAMQALANIFSTEENDKCNEYFTEFVHILIDCISKSTNFEYIPLLKFVVQNTPISRLNLVSTEIIDYVQKLWLNPPSYDDIVTIVIELIPILAARLSDKFAHLIPQVTTFLLNCIYSHAGNNLVITKMALLALMALRKFSQDYFFLIVPEVISLVNTFSSSTQVCVQMLEALRVFVQYCDTSNFVSTILRCSLNALHNDSNEVVHAALQVIYSIVVVLGVDHFSFYQNQVRSVLLNRKIDTANFDKLLRCPKGAKFSDFTFIITNDPSSIMQKRETVLKLQQMSAEQIVSSYNYTESETPWNRKEWWHDLVTITIHQSPCHFIRCCSFLTLNLFDIAESIFFPAFLCLWKTLSNEHRSTICGCLTIACLSDSLPNSIRTTLVGLFEFMEQNEFNLEIENSVLLKACEESSQYAKALYFAHRCYYANKNDLKGIENLIRLSSHLGLSKSVKGLSSHVMNMTMHAKWCEQLGQWEKAEKLYQEKKNENDSYRGLLRTQMHQKKWEDIVDEMKSDIQNQSEEIKNEVLPIYAIALFHRQEWEQLGKILDYCPMTNVYLYIVKSLYFVSIKNYEEAMNIVNDGFVALANLSRSVFKHDKAELYPLLVKAQQLQEIKEIINNQENMKFVWEKRIKLVREDFDTYYDILSVRLTHIDVNNMIPNAIKMLKIALKRDEINMFDLAFKKLFPDEKNRTIEVKFLYIKGMWARGNRIDAVKSLNQLLLEAANYDKTHEPNKKLNARMYYYCAHWILQLHNLSMFKNCFNQAVVALERSLSYESTYYNSWHRWSWANSVMFRHQPTIVQHASNAISGFCRCVQLRQSKSFSDLIQMISLLFRADFNSDQFKSLSSDIEKFSDETFLQIIPQLFAQFTSKKRFVVMFVSQIVSKLLPDHFHALIFPLLLLTRTLRSDKDDNEEDLEINGEEDDYEELLIGTKQQAHVQQLLNTCTNNAVKRILQKFFMINPDAVSQALTISEGLLLCSTSSAESMFEHLNNALHALFKNNVNLAFRSLTDAITLPQRKDDEDQEVQFKKEMGECMIKLCNRGKAVIDVNEVIKELTDLWKKVKNYLSGVRQVKAYITAPELAMLRDSVIAVPGTYQAGVSPSLIQQFDASLDIIHSKQRPRNLIIYDQNGLQHLAILKGHEDLRLDQRIMQFFELINQHISHDFLDESRSLRIIRYQITPISKKAGLIQCVDGAETLFSLISNYRTAHNIDPLCENNLFKEFSSANIDYLRPIQRLEILNEAKNEIPCDDLRESIWLKSISSREWVTRILNFSQSSALMSVIGYIIGLGDRHPSNLMLHNASGALIHVDFGDCFEVSKIRIRFPETIPFRLTRMMISALGPSGIEGDFRITAEDTLVLVQNHCDSIMAVLDIFLQEPLESDEILDRMNDKLVKNMDTVFSSIEETWDIEGASDVAYLEIKDATEKIQTKIVGESDQQTTSNEAVTKYIDDLINQATDMYNLSYLYHGWTPLW